MVLDRFLSKISAVALSVSMLAASMADEFTLRDGRTIRGVVKSTTINSETKVKLYAVEVAPDVLVRLTSTEVKTHKAISPREAEYATVMTAPLDLVESHLKAAAWCKVNGLSHQEVAHYERAIELEPDNSLARAALNYVRGKDGRWVKVEEQQLEERGKVRVGGRFRFPEVVAIEEAEERAKKEGTLLAAEIAGWQRDILDKNRRAADSQAKLQSLDGPYASTALRDILFPKRGSFGRQPPPEVLRQMYVEVLSRLADSTAIQTLVDMSLRDSSTTVRDLCLDKLKQTAPRVATMAYIHALKSADNVDAINAAGRALAAMRDEVAVMPLIDRIVSTHKVTIPGNSSTSVGFNGDGTFSAGGTKSRTIPTSSNNPDVLGALVAITGQNFQYDRGAWLNWYNEKYFGAGRDLRRDQ